MSDLYPLIFENCGDRYAFHLTPAEANRIRRELNAWHRQRKTVKGPYKVRRPKGFAIFPHWRVVRKETGGIAHSIPDRTGARKKAQKYANKLNRKHAREAQP